MGAVVGEEVERGAGEEGEEDILGEVERDKKGMALRARAKIGELSLC